MQHPTNLLSRKGVLKSYGLMRAIEAFRPVRAESSAPVGKAMQTGLWLGRLAGSVIVGSKLTVGIETVCESVQGLSGPS